MPSQKDLSALFNPKSVAVVGASQDPQKLGAIVLKNILDSGFKGQIYPVNPKYSSLNKLTCYKSLADLPKTPDVAILAVPSRTVNQLLKDCAEKKISNVVVFASGYKEMDPEGEALEKELVKLAAANHINLLGPNCLGFVNNETPLNATFGKPPKIIGNLRFASQSGAIAASLFDWCEQNELGFRQFITLGNKSVLNEIDLLNYFAQELTDRSNESIQEGLSELNPIGLYLESISNGPQLLNVAKEICRQNPILLLKPGKTSSGASAMSSHTGAIAQEDDILQALVSQAGIIRCQTLQTFFDFAKAFSWENLPAGPKVGIVSNAGGPAVVSADAVTAEGLELAQLDETTKKQLAEILPRAASIINPVDVLGDALADRYSQAMEVLLQKPAVDSLLVVLTPQIMTQIEKTAWVIGESAKKFHKPIFCSFMGGTAVSYGEGILNKYKIPSFRFPEEAISAISAMWRYKTIRDELNAKSETTGKLVPAGQTGKLEHVRELIQKAVNNQEHALDNLAANALITDAGISTPSTAAPKTLEAAKDFAKQNGYPVVLKLSSPKILHKGAVGGIVLDIETDEALTTAWYQLERRAAELKVSLKSEVGWQIQKAVAKGVELIVGLKQDADFGSVLLFGAGGVFAELIEDKNLHLLPIDINEAKQLVEKSKVYKVLKGANEEPPYALDKLYQLIVNLGRLGLALPEAKEIEINPVTIDLNNVWAVDAKVLLKEGAAKAKGPVKFQLAGCVNHQVLANQFNQYDFESEEPLVFQPGQYINVKVAPNTIRAYSIATRTSDRHFSLLVDTRPGGPGSHFFANLKAGDIMTYMGPFGVFTFNPDDGCRDILLLATGSGMSAIRCMIDSALMEQKLTKPLKLYFGLTHESEIFWQEHFDDLQNRFPNFSYQICLCEPDAAWSGPKGFITKLVAADYPDASNCSAYLCGHRNMIADASELLLKLGCPKSRIYTERFA